MLFLHAIAPTHLFWVSDGAARAVTFERLLPSVRPSVRPSARREFLPPLNARQGKTNYSAAVPPLSLCLICKWWGKAVTTYGLTVLCLVSTRDPELALKQDGTNAINRTN